jgi:hypothetical protein
MPGNAPTPAELLDAADRLLTGEIRHTRELWPRPVAFLTRLALERAIDQLLIRRNPEFSAVYSWRAKLLCLSRYLDARDAARIAYLWHELSRAGHYHAYELVPTAAELRRWHTQATDLIDVMSTAQRVPARPADVSRSRSRSAAERDRFDIERDVI